MRLNFLILLFLSTSNLWSKNSFSVAPTRVEVDLTKPKTESFVILNNGDGPIRVEASTIYFPVDSKDMENGVSLNPETAQLDNLSEAIRVSPRLVSLAPGEQRVVRISVRPPIDIKPGEYRAHILFQMLEFSEIQKNTVQDAAGKKVGMQLSFKLEMAASVVGLNGLPDPKIQTTCSISNNNVSFEVTNTSVWRFDGWIQVINSEGKILNEVKNFVLRESKRTFSIPYDPFKNEKKLTLKFLIKKEDPSALSVAECITK